MGTLAPSINRVVKLAQNLRRRPKPGEILWTPITPTLRQEAFLNLTEEEALFGGAAGGGKSAALLAWALEGVDTPGYAAIIFRRTLPEHKRPGGLIPLSHEWELTRKGAVWNGTDKTWTFPSGAVVAFSAMPHEADATKFQGGAYIRAVFDELTHFTEFQYTWVMSRLRRRRGFPFQPAIRSGSNPGSIGHIWVKKRFLTDEAMQKLRDGCDGIYYKEGRAFVPSRLDDNPHLDRDDYRRKLQHLPPVLRERLLNGDWTVNEDGVINSEWFRYYEADSHILRALKPEGGTVEGGVIDCRECVRFATIDTAGTDEDAVKKARGKEPSWTVVAIWDYWPARNYLFLRHVVRRRMGWIDLKDAISQALDDWGVAEVLLEDAHWGRALAAELRRLGGATVKMISPAGKSKLSRSVPLQNKLETGEVYWPRGNNSWLNEWEAEFISWRGHPNDADDQIDVASYAAMYSGKKSQAWGGPVRTETGRVASQFGGRRVATSLSGRRSMNHGQSG